MFFLWWVRVHEKFLTCILALLNYWNVWSYCTAGNITTSKEARIKEQQRHRCFRASPNAVSNATKDFSLSVNLTCFYFLIQPSWTCGKVEIFQVDLHDCYWWLPTCGELCRHNNSVSSYQRGHYPCVAVASNPNRVGHLEDSVGLFFCAVKKNDGALELLQLVLDLWISIIYGHVQQYNFLQFPAHKAVLDGATDLDRGRRGWS